MTLINKATRSFLIACLIVASLGGLFCYTLLRRFFDDEASQQLKAQQAKIITQIKATNQIPQHWFSLSDSLIFQETDQTVVETMDDTLLPNPLDNSKLLEYRVLTFGIATPNQNYEVTIQKPLYETEDLSKALFIVFGLVILGLVLALILVNYFLSNQLWRPFYQTLEQLKTFRIKEEKPLNFDTTDINEFKTLQNNLSQLTQKVRHDYLNLKTFTENASHELQTPLAVIQANLEQLLQAQNLSQNQLEQIVGLLDTLGRLSKMNQTLLLLTKIENQQFLAKESLDFSAVLTEKLGLWEALIRHKYIVLNTTISPKIAIKINPYLADVLLNNLLSNALKHNHKKGEIKIELTHKSFVVSNTGTQPTVPVEQLWERFRKDSTQAESVGLGLSLVRQICETSGLVVHYDYANGWHKIEVCF